MTDIIEEQLNLKNEISLIDLTIVILNNLRLIVLVPLVVGLASLGVSFFIPPTYIAKTQFLPPQQQQSSASALIQSLGSMGGLASAATSIKNPADQYIAFLKTQSVLNAMIDRFNLQEKYQTKYRIDARNALLSSTRIQSGKDNIIQLEVEDEDPKFAAELANGYVSELQKMMGRLSLSEAQQRRAFFERKIVEAKAALAESDKSLRSTGINASTLKSSPLAAVEIVARIKGAITAQEIRVGSLRGYLTDSAPELRQGLLELAILKEQLIKAAKDDTTLNTGKLEDSYIERYRDYKYKETLYEMFSKQYELARVDEAREGAVIQVIDVAEIPEYKDKPKKALIAVFTTLITALILIIFVFAKEFINKSTNKLENFNKINLIKKTFLDNLLGNKNN